MFRTFARPRLATGSVVVALAAALLTTPAALADTAPVNPDNPATPVTVSADALPTAQIDGVVWSQVVVGRTVYVAGSFTTARPAGAVPGQDTQTRNNLMSYNIDTGEMTSWAPDLNGQARSITAAPDGSRVYVAGDFTQVDGEWRMHVAAFDTASGALDAGFAPALSANALSIAASNSTVYVGGDFASAASDVGQSMQTRGRVAAFNASDGALLGFRADANAPVTALALTADHQKLVAGGRFTTLSGGSAYGLGWVGASSGNYLAMPANREIRDSGTGAAITTLAADSSGIYGGGYLQLAGNNGGNLEGTFRVNAQSGAVTWIADCHGDTYSVFPSTEVLYVASHHHYCGNMGGFPQTDPWSYYYANAFSKAVTGTNTADIYGYPDHPGQPAPSLLHWYPDFRMGTFTGQNQSTWSVAGNDDYIVYGGEFPTVNGIGQQGLVRFAREGLAPNKVGPLGKVTGVTGTASAPNVVDLQWASTWDRDNETLAYRVYRESEDTTPACETSLTATFWRMQNLTCTDEGATPGATNRYRVVASDPFGNTAKSDWVEVTTPAGPGAENQPPTAAFTVDTAELTVTADGSGSADPDGSITGYAWEFGDGATGNGQIAEHTYDNPGTYTVTLTVTDNDDARTSTSQSVAVDMGETPQQPGVQPEDPQNPQEDPLTPGEEPQTPGEDPQSPQDPLTPDGQSPQTPGESPEDPQTPVPWIPGVQTGENWQQSMVWEVRNPLMPWEQPTVTSPATSAGASDVFSRVVSQGWGSADAGGTWTLNGDDGLYRVADGVGQIAMDPGAWRRAQLADVSLTDVEVSARVAVNRKATSAYVAAQLNTRVDGWGNQYTNKALLYADGSVVVELAKLVGDTQTSFGLTLVPGLKVCVGESLQMRVQTVGTGTTALRIKVWKTGTAEPAEWTMEHQDSTSELQGAGAVEAGGYLSKSASNSLKIAFDDITANKP